LSNVFEEEQQKQYRDEGESEKEREKEDEFTTQQWQAQVMTRNCVEGFCAVYKASKKEGKQAKRWK
jgi:hypothetical protein